MTDTDRPYPEEEEPVELAVPVEPFAARVMAIENLAESLADTSKRLKEELVSLTRNLDSIVGYLREISRWKGEFDAWRLQAESRLQALERNERNRPPSTI